MCRKPIFPYYNNILNELYKINDYYTFFHNTIHLKFYIINVLHN